MAFSSTITGRTVIGNKRFTWGTFSDSTAAGTGGNIDTGLNQCQVFFEPVLVSAAQVTGASASVILNETLPVDGSAVTVIKSLDQPGWVYNWTAIGTGFS